MKRADKFEQDMLKAYEGDVLKSISPTKADLTKFKAAASATFIKERRVNIRLSSPDLMDIQARALEEGLPYQRHKLERSNRAWNLSRTSWISCARAKMACISRRL